MVRLGGGTGKRDIGPAVGGGDGLLHANFMIPELLVKMLSLRWSSTNWPLSIKALSREVKLIRSDDSFVRIRIRYLDSGSEYGPVFRKKKGQRSIF